MTGYLIFAFGFVVGVLATLLILGLLEMAHRGEEEQDVMEAYYWGVRDERARREIGLEDHLEDPEVG